MTSGSDPPDDRFPEEFRIELSPGRPSSVAYCSCYVPPYLAIGLQQPSFDLSNDDWVYGESYTITSSSVKAVDNVEYVNVSNRVYMYGSSINPAITNILCLANDKTSDR